MPLHPLHSSVTRLTKEWTDDEALSSQSHMVTWWPDIWQRQRCGWNLSSPASSPSPWRQKPFLVKGKKQKGLRGPLGPELQPPKRVFAHQIWQLKTQTVRLYRSELKMSHYLGTTFLFCHPWSNFLCRGLFSQRAAGGGPGCVWLPGVEAGWAGCFLSAALVGPSSHRSQQELLIHSQILAAPWRDLVACAPVVICSSLRQR